MEDEETLEIIPDLWPKKDAEREEWERLDFPKKSTVHLDFPKGYEDESEWKI